MTQRPFCLTLTRHRPFLTFSKYSTTYQDLLLTHLKLKESGSGRLEIKLQNLLVWNGLMNQSYDINLLHEIHFIERLDSVKKRINIWSSRGFYLWKSNNYQVFNHNQEALRPIRFLNFMNQNPEIDGRYFLIAENRNQKSGLRKSEIRNRKSEIGNRKSEIGNRKSEIRNQKSEIKNPSVQRHMTWRHNLAT